MEEQWPPFVSFRDPIRPPGELAVEPHDQGGAHGAPVRRAFGAGEGPKGWAVRPLKWHASWVQNVVRQFGLYLLWAQEICGDPTLVREDRVGQTPGASVVPPGAQPSS